MLIRWADKPILFKPDRWPSRVANFRSGLFNPTPQDDPYDMPDLGLQMNRPRVFGPYASADVTTDDWGARYLAWMALGGTGAEIPQLVWHQVAVTQRWRCEADASRATRRTPTCCRSRRAHAVSWAGAGHSCSSTWTRTCENELIAHNGDPRAVATVVRLANPTRVIVPLCRLGDLTTERDQRFATICDRRSQLSNRRSRRRPTR